MTSPVFTPKDSLLPLIVSQSTVEASAVDLTIALVGYVNRLVEGGYGGDSLPDGLHDLYQLDRFIGQVNNGGVNQFIANSRAQGAAVPDLFEPALRATRRIDLPALEGIVQAAADWVRAHPQEAEQVTATSGPEALAALDKRVYALSMTRTQFPDFLAGLSPKARAWIEAREEPQTNAAAFKAAQIAMEEMPKKGPHNAARIAAEAIADVVRENVEASGRYKEPKDLEDRIAAKQNILLAYIVNELNRERPDLEERLFAVILREISEGFGVCRDSYVLHATAWILDHANLQVVETDSYESAVADVLARSPFAGMEKAARKLDKLRDSVPEDCEIAMGMALTKDGWFGKRGFVTAMPYDLEGGLAARPDEGIAIKTTVGRIVARREGDTILVHATARALSQAQKQKRAKALAKAGQTQAAINALMSDGMAKPGRILGRAKVDPELRALALDLGLAEVLGLVTDGTPLEKERRIFIGRGRIDTVDRVRRQMTWRFPFEDAVLHVGLGPDGAEIRMGDKGTVRRFEAAEIASYRAAHGRDG